jgi:hypothetical protein
MPNVAARRHVRCIGDLPRLLLAVSARTVLWSVLLLALWASLPAALGKTLRCGTNCGSCIPELNALLAKALLSETAD